MTRVVISVQPRFEFLNAIAAIPTLSRIEFVLVGRLRAYPKHGSGDWYEICTVRNALAGIRLNESGVVETRIGLNDTDGLQLHSTLRTLPRMLLEYSCILQHWTHVDDG